MFSSFSSNKTWGRGLGGGFPSPLTGLILHYDLLSYTGGAITDLSGNDITPDSPMGTVTGGGAQYQVNITDYKTQYIYNHMKTDYVTVCAWSKVINNVSDVAVCNFDSGWNYDGFLLYHRRNYRYDATINGRLYETYTRSTNTAPSNTWEFVCFKFTGNGGYNDLYVNGNIVTSYQFRMAHSTGDDFRNGDTLMRIGDNNSALGSIQIYNQGLTDQEILDLYNNSKAAYGY